MIYLLLHGLIPAVAPLGLSFVTRDCDTDSWIVEAVSVSIE